ncbi:MAG: helicase [Thermofilum sp. ex4484_82]|nr:MAG: helicase [Thermofilum sp. ex4484_82]OYT36223.1 MAG: helicase [Archaeoglobales archaeon ex4484_92]
MIELVYDRGTIVLKGSVFAPPSFFKWDERVKSYRALAFRYRETVTFLKKWNANFRDNVLDLQTGKIKLIKTIKLRNYQKEALENWVKAGKKGVVVLPTGAGKTLVAVAAINFLSMPSLVVVPTLELMDQWEKVLGKYFSVGIGRFGGGRKDIEFLTIATYDSAYLNAEFLGNKFMLLIFDEVHHLPSPGYRQIAELNAAPYRLGLTATPEREDNLHLNLGYLVGSDEEREKYFELVDKYKRYLSSRGIKIRSIRDFEKLIMRSGLDKEAREALLAWLEARRIAFNAAAKIEVLKEILAKHRGERIIIFTENNEIVRKISLNFLIPEITYKTSDEERRLIMEKFRKGEINAVVTSKVLEEGVDVPEANVAIVLSGTGSRREFIQRLGRILRPKKGKRAVLYEIVTAGTAETRVSRKRRKGVS